MADPDFELRRGPGLLYLPSRRFFLQSSISPFSTKIRVGRPPAFPLDPPVKVHRQGFTLLVGFMLEDAGLLNHWHASEVQLACEDHSRIRLGLRRSIVGLY